MFTNHVNQQQSNVQKSYILKSKTGLEKYVAKTSTGNYYLSTLTDAQPFDDPQEADKIADMLNGSNQQVEVLEIQNRTMW